MPSPRKKATVKKAVPAKAAPKPKDKAVGKKVPSAPIAARAVEKPKPPAGRARPAAVERDRGVRAASTASARAEPIVDRADDELKAKPGKPIVDKDLLDSVRGMLNEQRQRLLSVVASTQAQMAEKDGDLPDVSDRASEGFEDELAVGLMAVEAAQLDDIDAALRRIDEGSYGICEDCAKAIPRKRLEFLPFARRCLGCEGAKERRTRVSELQSEDDDGE